MKKSTVIGALGALAQETRLDIFRLLVQKGPEGTARRRDRRAARTALAHDVVSPEPAQVRRPRYLTAREPLDHLQRQLQGDERPARLLDRELLRRTARTMRTRGRARLRRRMRAWSDNCRVKEKSEGIMKRFHAHLRVDDLESSVRFYSTLFESEPAVLKADYAKWMLDDPRGQFCDHRGIDCARSRSSWAAGRIG